VVKSYGVSSSSSSSSSTASWDAIGLPRGTHMDVSPIDCLRGVISSRRITVLWTTVFVFFSCSGCVLRPGAVCGLLRITLLHGGLGEFVARIGGW